MQPLVSILIPAYSPRFFAQAFGSALAQTWANVEIVVGDDCPGEEIRAIVASRPDPRVRYERHQPGLGFSGNFTRLFEIARGEYIKYLNDDDLLAPACVQNLLVGMHKHPGTVLASSRRLLIDAEGRRLPDEDVTQPLLPASQTLEGRALGNHLILSSTNRLGEPSTVLFRRDALRVEGGSIFRWGDNEYLCLADMSLWLRLLSVGHAWWDQEPLSAYRQHGGQLQRSAHGAARCVIERWLIVEDGARAGFLSDPEHHAKAVRNAGTNFRYWSDREDSPPEFKAALAEFAPRIPAEFLA
ncbi:MAG: glycosyltransferase [Burkholderiales bacterium]|nr:glycosyltransferase [Burkholderiales bacterium]MCL4686984.1 glycosyltransferase family 2 protein [Burkholderiales bacterium]